MFEGPFAESIVARAAAGGLVDIRIHDLRNWTHDRHRTVDDMPFGGGPGMILKPEPVFEALDEIGAEGAEVILLTPNGELFRQEVAAQLAQLSRLVLICGHYEGVDERVADALATRQISIGDYVLSGGEIPALVITDAVIRLLPGALGCADSTRDEAHSDGLLEYPQFTRPAVYRDIEVPLVVRSGDHQELARWKHREALRRTFERRPDLLRTEHWEEIRRLGLVDAAERDRKPDG
ncbi:MAG: tRNA (guanosine(37)-N1)-methyltransferase TrmD [Chloroflexi bacterium]|nr:tRNA (guanosine(37)-N1)-methyltransferase TrmD [Chloroflexota bacterium]